MARISGKALRALQQEAISIAKKAGDEAAIVTFWFMVILLGMGVLGFIAGCLFQNASKVEPSTSTPRFSTSAPAVETTGAGRAEGAGHGVRQETDRLLQVERRPGS